MHLMFLLLYERHKKLLVSELGFVTQVRVILMNGCSSNMLYSLWLLKRATFKFLLVSKLDEDTILDS